MRNLLLVPHWCFYWPSTGKTVCFSESTQYSCSWHSSGCSRPLSAHINPNISISPLLSWEPTSVVVVFSWHQVIQDATNTIWKKHNFSILSPRLQTLIYVPLIFSLEGCLCWQSVSRMLLLLLHMSCFAFCQRFSFLWAHCNSAPSPGNSLCLLPGTWCQSWKHFLLLLYLSKTYWRTSSKSQSVSRLVGWWVGGAGPAVEPSQYGPSRKTLQDDVVLRWWFSCWLDGASVPNRSGSRGEGRNDSEGFDDEMLRYQRARRSSNRSSLDVVHLLPICCRHIFASPSSSQRLAAVLRVLSVRLLPARLPICRLKFSGHHFKDRARRRAHVCIIERGK